MKSFKLKQRLSIAGSHLLLSAIVVCLALFLVFFIWYPDIYAAASGVHKIVVVLFMVDLILGPMCTFIIYKENKKVLYKDICAIFLIQILALSYGLYVLNQGRPVWAVFVVDDIELISPSGIYREYEIDFKPEYRHKLWQKPTLVSAVYSKDKEVEQKQKQNEMFDGISLAARPETYQPIENSRQQILQKLKPISDLSKYNNRIPEQLTRTDAVAAGYLPVKGFEKDVVAIVDKHGNIVEMVDLRPWD